MNASDLIDLAAGDSIIGLADVPDDELPIVYVGPLRIRGNSTSRDIDARRGAHTVHATVREGDRTIRCVWPA